MLKNNKINRITLAKKTKLSFTKKNQLRVSVGITVDDPITVVSFKMEF